VRRAAFERQVPPLEREQFADPKAGCGEEPEQQPVARRCQFEERGELLARERPDVLFFCLLDRLAGR
jgi:hypothetical protein